MPWPNVNIRGEDIVRRLLDSNPALSAEEFAGRLVVHLDGNPIIPISPKTEYPGSRLRGFMERAEVTPETWHSETRIMRP